MNNEKNKRKSVLQLSDFIDYRLLVSTVFDFFIG